MVYFLIFTVVGSFVAYKLVLSAYKNYDYEYVTTGELPLSQND